jgi:hypothetical protein
VQNPFKFGSIVTGQDFADRRRELAEITRELTDGQHLFLLSPRRYGKATRLTERDIGEALSTVLQQDAPHFSAAWERLSLHQRQVVQAIAQGGGRNVFSSGFLTSHRLGSHSSVQTSLRLLLKEQVLFKTNGEYRIADPFFREWIGTRLA